MQTGHFKHSRALYAFIPAHCTLSFSRTVRFHSRALYAFVPWVFLFSTSNYPGSNVMVDTEFPTIIDSSATINRPSATGSIIVGISVSIMYRSMQLIMGS